MMLKKHARHTRGFNLFEDYYKRADFKKSRREKELIRQKSQDSQRVLLLFLTLLESGLRSTRGVHLAESDDVACKIGQNHLTGC